MAENRVLISVESENRTKAGFESAKRDAEKAGDDAGRGFMDKFQSWLAGKETKGLFGNAGAGGGIGGIFSTIASSGPVGIGGAAAAAGALIVELDGIVSGFAAAAAGAGAFAALALPAFKILQANYSQLVTNQNDFANASQNIATAIKTSAADAAAYQKTIADPQFRGAVLLLNDQSTAWQNLTTSQQNQLVALSNNKAMLKLLLPDQKTALGILMKEADAWNNLTPSQQAAAGALDNIRTAYNKMSLAFQPLAFTIFGDALKVVSDLMPKLLPLANAFATALGPLLTKLDQFTKSQGFNDWFQKFLSYVGPATTAIGTGIGKVTIAFGELFTIMSKKDVVNSINIAFTLLAFTIQQIGGYIKLLMLAWDYSWHAIEFAFITAAGRILHAAVVAFGWIPGLGPELKTLQGQFAQFAGGVQANLDGITKSANSAWGALAGAISTAANAAVGLHGGGTGPGPGKVGHLAGGGPGSGWTIVGEHGPELLDLPQGSYVHPAGSFGGRGGGGTQVVFQFPSGGTGLDALFVQWLKQKAMQLGGGGKNSVQVAFGQVH